MAILLLASLAFQLLPCTGPCALSAAGPAAGPVLTRLRVCDTADRAPGSLADQSILRSEMLLPAPPPPVRNGPSPAGATLSEGHAAPVYRPPRTAA